jgi:acyl carrier protein
MQSKEEVFEEIKSVLVELFEIDAEDITMQAKLYEDLDLDSIDAVDLVVKLQELTGSKIQPEEFKQVRNVEDVVNNVHSLVAA